MSALCCRLNRSTQRFILDGKIECMQYFPKRTDLSVCSQAHRNKVARQLNERPRKTLGFEIPAEKFNASVALTG
jgi:IS30 family transposase